jgi:N-acetylmuramoyl-L-alanine amidase
MSVRTQTNYLVIHSSATPAKMDVDIKDITEWHVARGFTTVGYHFVIKRDGTRQTGRPVNDVGAHVVGHNHHSVGICMVGGVADDTKTPANNFTKAQWTTLYLTLVELHIIYPTAVIVGHKDLALNTECPSFSVSEYVGDKPELAPIIS